MTRPKGPELQNVHVSLRIEYNEWRKLFFHEDLLSIVLFPDMAILRVLQLKDIYMIPGNVEDLKNERHVSGRRNISQITSHIV